MRECWLTAAVCLGFSLAAETAWGQGAGNATGNAAPAWQQIDAPVCVACRFRRRHFGLPCTPQPLFDLPAGALLRTRLITGHALFLEITTDTLQKLKVMQMDVTQKQ